jgi:hypothetical protein
VDPQNAAEAEELEAIFASRKAFLQAAAVHATECRLYWAAEGAGFTLNAPVRVILGFEGEDVRFVFRGTVMKTVDEALRGNRTGAVIRVVGEEQRAFGSAISYARGVDPKLGRRRGERFRARIAAKLGDGLAEQAVLLDISEHGAFAQLQGDPPPVGSLQPLCIGELGEGGDEVIPVRVAWVGPRDGQSGCGLEFLDLTEQAKTWLDRTLERVKRL